MGFFSDLFSGIGSVLSGALSTVAGAISKVVGSAVSALSSLASSAVGVLGAIASKGAAFLGALTTLPLGPLGPILGPILVQLAVKVIVKAVEYLAKKLGIIEGEDKAEEVGYRVEEAAEHEDWKKQDEFDSFEDYYAYLKEQIPDRDIDYQKMKENRMRYMALGVAELTHGIEENVGIEIPPEFLEEIGRCRMETKEFEAIVEAYKELGYPSINISEYLKGELSREESHKIEDALLSTMQKYYPGKDSDALHERLGEMRMASRDDMCVSAIYKDVEPKLEQLAKEKKNLDIEDVEKIADSL